MKFHSLPVAAAAIAAALLSPPIASAANANATEAVRPWTYSGQGTVVAAPTACQKTCLSERNACFKDVGKPGLPSKRECVQTYNECRRTCVVGA